MFRFSPLYLGIKTAINCWNRDPWFFWQELQAACREIEWVAP